MSTNKTFNKVQLDVKFTQATTRANLISEENISISFGKISKYFADLHSQAFTGYTHPTYTARTGKPTGNQTPGFGSTFTISQITSDGTGHVTAATDRTVKIPDTTMGAASADAAGSKGLVPAPAAGKQTSFLRGDGTWATPTNTNTTYTIGTSGNDVTLTPSSGGVQSITVPYASNAAQAVKLRSSAARTDSTVDTADTTPYQKYWVKIASCYTTGNYTDLESLWAVNDVYGNRQGILKVRARVEGTAGTFGNTRTIRWIVADSDIDVNRFAIVCYNNRKPDGTAASGTATVELWWKSTAQYASFSFVLLDETRRTGKQPNDWVLYDTSTYGQAALPTTGNITYSVAATILNSTTGNATSANALNLTHGNELNFSKLASTGHVWLGYRWNTQGTETSGGTTITTYKFGNADGAGGLAGLEATTSTFKSGNFGDQLIVERTGGANMAGITFKNTNGVLGYIAANTVDGDLYHYGASDTSTMKYTILDSNNYKSYEIVLRRGNAGKSNMNDVGRLHASVGMTDLSDPGNNYDNPMNGTTKSTSWHLYWDASYKDDPNGSNSWVAQIANKAGTAQWWVRSRKGGTITNGTEWAAGWEHLTITSQAGAGSATNPVYVDSNGHTQACTYSLNKSVPSNALFTDSNVRQSATTTTDYRPIVTGAKNTTTIADLDDEITSTVYTSENFFVQPSTGSLYATQFFTKSYLSDTGVNVTSNGIYARSYFKRADNTVADYKEYLIRTYNGKITSNDGILVSVGGGGLTIVGGGESSSALAGLISDDQTKSDKTTLNVGGTLNTAIPGNSEQLIMSSDESIYFITNCQTIANRKPVCLNTSSYFYPGTTKTGSIGTSSYMWNSVYAATIYENGTSLASKYAAIGHTHSYLPLAGGTMTGDITFATISGDPYPISSKGIKWGGGTDAIDMYYNLRASDTGELIINMRDDSNVRISFAYNGAVKSYIDTNGTYNGNASTATKLGTANKGSTTKGIYLDAGVPKEMTYSLGSTVNTGTAKQLAYYSGANAISATHDGTNTYDSLYFKTGTNAKSARQIILGIYGQTYGNDASTLISGTAGVFSYGDGGPQIDFNTSSSGSQAGALIFTDHDTAGTGASWHFVSNQSDWNVTSKRFHARTGISIGTNLPNTSYNLYVNGTSQFNGTATMSTNAFGTQLIVERSGSSNYASLGFKNNLGMLGYIGANAVDTNLYHIYGGDTSKQYIILDTGNTSVTTSGSGNAITALSFSNGTFTATKGSTFSLSTHTHNYAGSSSAGGAATSANKLNTNAGASNNPVYFSGGVPVACNVPASGSWFNGGIPEVRSDDGVMEIGKYIDFHTTNTSTADYDYRIETTTTAMTLHATGSFNTLTIKSPGSTQLSFQTTSSGKAYTASGITCYPLGTSGMTALFNFGGNVVIGGGEAAKTLYDNDYDTIKTVERETLYLASDSAELHLITDAQTYANRKVLRIIGGQLTKSGGSWIAARDHAPVYSYKGGDGTSGSFYPAIFSKSKTGGWAIGTIGNDDTLYASYTTDANYSSNTNTSTYTIQFPKDSGTLALTSSNITGTSANVTGTVAIAHGGTGATTRLAALKALTNEGVGTNAQYFLTITQDWGKGGYSSVANVKTVLGLKSAAYTESSDYVPNTQAGVNAAINLLSTGGSIPGLADYYVSQYASGGTTTTSYHRRPISALWNAFKGLITLATTGSGNAVTDVSIANDGDHNRKITVTKGSTFSLSTHTHNYAGSSSAGGAANSANVLNYNNSVTATTSGLQYTHGGITIGTADGNSKEGSDPSYKLWSYPAGGTATNSTSANIQNLRLYWTTAYFRDIFLSPNNDSIYHRAVINNSAKPWYVLLDSNNLETYSLHTPDTAKALSTGTGQDMSPITRPQNLHNRSNKLALIPGSNITVEYSTDAGSNWTDMGLTADMKGNLFNDTISATIPIGPNDSTDRTTSMQTRITITCDGRDQMIDQYILWLNSSYQTISIDLQVAYGNATTTFTNIRTGLSCKPWIYQYILNTETKRFGTSTTSAYVNKIRFVIKYTGINGSNKTSKAIINSIAGYSGIYWGGAAKNNLMIYDHLYTWDNSQNAKFPAQLSATGATFTSSSFGPLKIIRSGSTNAASIKFYNNTSTYLGALGINTANSRFLRWNTDDSTSYEIIDRSVVSSTPSAKVDTNWNTTADRTTVVTKGWIAYWNGAYNGTTSNLTYCNRGAFGTIVTKSTTDYSKVSISRNLTSGTKVGTITIDGTATDLYCQTNSDTKVTQNIASGSANLPLLMSYYNTDTAVTAAQVVYRNNSIYANPSAGSITANKFYGDITGDGLNAGIYDLLNTDNPVFNGAEWMLTSIPSSSGGTSTPSFRRVKTAKFADYVTSNSRDVLFNDSTNTSKSITLSNPPTDTQYLKLYFKSSGNMGQSTMDNSVYSIAEVPYMTDVNLGGILQVAQPSDNMGVLKSTVLAFTIKITNNTLTLTKASYPSRLDGSVVANDTHLSANIIKVVAYR